ncbi:YCF48-related protein [Acidipila sp. EB88]|uniref:WD40/YVTN/BNR-like repeat-containing protein n=1 Tax=Acidipila sp. EB88 TaxID=2305226 RepID=UPI000F5E30FA|nr:YCF48-related protein [Acidipila sp. EB88]RRA47115.1 transcriptional regulator [Acidipila sp. EB88]
MTNRTHRTTRILPRLFNLAAFATLVLAVTPFSTASAQTPSASAQRIWTSVGPDGGDARSLAPDPKNNQHLYLGTLSSWVYETNDAGKSWQRLAKLGSGDNLAVDNIFVDASDPKTLVAGVFEIDGHGGSIYISHDGGKKWAVVPDMDGQSVRALAQAPSNPKIYMAGTVSGVYRSNDGGQHWAAITPAHSTELHEVESVAIDPVDTNIMYAGTWHLPWKTTDGGAHWTNIKNGLIDDSDVFSIIIDPHTPSVVYASACSGIYKSDSAGDLFHKVQGIPSTARRTRVLMQDPTNAKIVYAGTTEGLYKTADAGTNWTRLTGPDVIINDVFVDPTNDQHLMLATDRSGVLASEDGGKTFSSSNSGFSQRLVQTLLVDQKQPGTLYAGVLNDKIYGGMFVSKDDGSSWQQQSEGLNGRDVFVLAQGTDGNVYAGTNDGVAKLSDGKWQTIGDLVQHDSHPVVSRVHGRKVTKTVETSKKMGAIQGRVNSLDFGGLDQPSTAWFAATAKGVYRSADNGTTWEMTKLPPADYRYVDALGSRVVAGQRGSLMLSDDAGQNWKPIPVPTGLTGINALAVSGDNVLWAGGREGVFYTKDSGETWQQIKNLPLGEIGGLDYDPSLKKVLVSSRTSTTIFGVDASGSPWKYWQAGWRVHQVLQQGNRLVGASLFDGVVLEARPQNAGTATPGAPSGAQ